MHFISSCSKYTLKKFYVLVYSQNFELLYLQCIKKDEHSIKDSSNNILFLLSHVKKLIVILSHRRETIFKYY